MHVNFKIDTPDKYFAPHKINWNEDDDTKIPVQQANELGKILATEASIYLLRSATGICGSLIDHMLTRRTLILEYETNYTS